MVKSGPMWSPVLRGTAVAIVVAALLVAGTLWLSRGARAQRGRAQPPIDAVIMWVDARAHAAAQAPAAHADATHVRRFADHGELRYALRSLWRHAPWLRAVHVCHHPLSTPPAWARPHPWLRWVSQRALVEAGSFNSRQLEAQLDRIPGLAELFLYLNDDMFLGPGATRSMLFPHDRPRLMLDAQIPIDARMGGDETYVGCRKTTAAVLGGACFDLCHVAYPLARAGFARARAAHAQAFARLGPHRTARDIWPILLVSVAEWRRVAGERAPPSPPRYLEVQLYDHAEDVRASTLQRLRVMMGLWKKKPPCALVCLNDSMRHQDRRVVRALRALMRQWWPDPAPWEQGLPGAARCKSGE